jgi:hypothetical protein
MPNIGKGIILGVERGDFAVDVDAGERDSGVVMMTLSDSLDGYGIATGSLVRVELVVHGSGNPNGVKVVNNLGSGDLLLYDDAGSDETFDVDSANVRPLMPVGLVRSLAAPSFSASAVDTTTFENDERTYMKGVKEWGEITFQTIADPEEDGDDTGPQWDWLKNLAITETPVSWFVQWPDGTLMICTAILVGMNVNAPMDELITTDVTLRITGEVEWTVNNSV